MSMAVDRTFVELNRASTARMRTLAQGLTEAHGQRRVGEHWTVGAALAHLAFWDRRVLDLLDKTEAAGTLVAPTIDEVANDLALPLWNAIPAPAAAQIAVEAAEALDRRLEEYPPALLEEVYARYARWVIRALHLNSHLDEIDAARQRS
jgi:hypothetical protein